MRQTGLLLLLALCGVSYCLCPDYWTPSDRPNACYAFINLRVPWVDAVTHCEILGGYLVEINSRAENAFLQNLTFINEASKVWVGMNDILQDGYWVLNSNSKAALAYTNWASGEPNNYLGHSQDCVSMYSDGHWDDEDCSLEVLLPFICETHRGGNNSVFA